MAIGPVQLLVVAFDEPHFTGAIVEGLTGCERTTSSVSSMSWW